ncbi:MAG: hypothetical protein DCC52_09610, partial [Chloroflexi bacterium]
MARTPICSRRSVLARWSGRWIPTRPTPSAFQARYRIRLAMIVLAALGAVIAAFVGATTVWNAPQTANIILWLGACALYGSAFVPWRAIVARLRTGAGRDLRAFGQRLWRRRVELFVLGVIMAVAFVARYWRLAWIPGIFGGDEGEMGA